AGTLRVRVVGLDGEPVARVGALLRRPDGSFGIAAVSDERGEFAIFGVPPGTYLLDAGGTHQEVVMTQGSTRATITWLSARKPSDSDSN
ncbi:MAG: carboxypeptidase-like regulatory domain-containing protein, partial [Myxococcota bacterium]